MTAELDQTGSHNRQVDDTIALAYALGLKAGLEARFPAITRDQAVNEAVKIARAEPGSEFRTEELQARRIARLTLDGYMEHLHLTPSRDPLVQKDTYPGLMAQKGYSPISEPAIQAAKAEVNGVISLGAVEQ